MSLSPDATFDFAQLAQPPRAKRPPSMAEAASKARQLVAAAEAEAGRIRDEARREGYVEGREAGRDELRALAEPVMQTLSAAVEETRELRARSADEVEQKAASLAVQIAEKVVAGALAVEPERVLDVVRGALRAIVDRDRIVILVNPEDLRLVRTGMAEVAASLGGIEHVDVQEERRVERGGAVVRTSVGEIDARVSTKLELARAAVEDALTS